MKRIEQTKAVQLRITERLGTKEIAAQLSVSVSCINRWLRDYPLTWDERKQTYCSEKGLENLRNYVETLRLSDDVVFSEDSDHFKVAKRRVYRELPEICMICGQGPLWNERPLRFHIDHINGNKRDNRKQNLRKTCPNCHTQTDTWGNKKRSLAHSSIGRAPDSESGGSRFET
jgi:hypothetical protein